MASVASRGRSSAVGASVFAKLRVGGQFLPCLLKVMLFSSPRSPPTQGAALFPVCPPLTQTTRGLGSPAAAAPGSRRIKTLTGPDYRRVSACKSLHGRDRARAEPVASRLRSGSWCSHALETHKLVMKQVGGL